MSEKIRIISQEERIKRDFDEKDLNLIHGCGYPVKFSIWVLGKLPPFEYGCKVRTKLLHEHLNVTPYDACHAVGDFTVELAKKRDNVEWCNCEDWLIGS